MSRVKRIVQLDPEVSRITGDAVLLVSKAAEYFLEHLAVNVAQITATSKRKTTKVDDLIDAIHSRSSYAFLRWDFPNEVAKKPAKKEAASTASAQSKKAMEPQQSSGLKAYFTSNKAPTETNSAASEEAQAAGKERALRFAPIC